MSTDSKQQSIADLVEKLEDAAMALMHYSTGPKEQAEFEAARQTLLEKFEGDLKEARLQSSASLLRHQLDVAQIAWAGPSTQASEAADVIERMCNGLEHYRNTEPWGEDDEEMLVEAREVVAGLKQVPEQAAALTWLDPASAPKDGRLLCLQVEFEDGNLEDHPFSQVTIGHNSLKNTGVDEWAFAGWNWTHDCFTQGVGKVIGWLPLRYLGVTQPGDRHPDDLAVDRFADDLKAKMAEGRAKGRQGWETCPPAKLSTMLRHHVEKGDPRDVALFCMMLWHQGAPIESITEKIGNVLYFPEFNGAKAPEQRKVLGPWENITPPLGPDICEQIWIETRKLPPANPGLLSTMCVNEFDMYTIVNKVTRKLRDEQWHRMEQQTFSEHPKPSAQLGLWARYVAGAIGCYLGYDSDDHRILNLALIIELRMLALKDAAVAKGGA